MYMYLYIRQDGPGGAPRNKGAHGGEIGAEVPISIYMFVYLCVIYIYICVCVYIYIGMYIYINIYN